MEDSDVTFSSGRSCQSQPGRFGMCLHLMRFSSFISFDMLSFNAIVLPLIFFWNQETGSPPYYIKRREIHLTSEQEQKTKEKHIDIGVRVTSSMSLLAPFSTFGKSPIVSLTVIARKGAPPAVLLAAA